MHVSDRPLRPQSMPGGAPRSSRGSRWALACLAMLALPALADIEFRPQFAGQFGEGQGADATFLQIDSGWRGSQVLWDESIRAYGQGTPISEFGWGTGLWGLSDWALVQQAAAAPAPGLPPIIGQWSGLQGSISFGNTAFNTAENETPRWGTVALAPIFTAPARQPAQVNEDNWTAHVQGYIRVTEAGVYNFSVLNDDGFFLALTGEGGRQLRIERDHLNYPERLGFADNLYLSPGLYGFDLGMFNRIEAGVVDLRWVTPGNADWTLVPTSSLLSVSAVPEPASGLLLLVGGALLLAGQRRRVAAAGVPRR